MKSIVPPPTAGAENCKAAGASGLGAIVEPATLVAGVELLATVELLAVVEPSESLQATPPASAQAASAKAASEIRDRAMGCDRTALACVFMRTRTLLILAVTCGLAILIAGGLQLLRIANQDTPEPPLSIGDTAQLGDAVVTVESYEATGEAIVVTLTLSGVDDADGLDGFTLIAPGKAVSAEPSACLGFTVAPVTCVLTFPAVGLEGSDRQLLFQRAAEHVRWRLA